MKLKHPRRALSLVVALGLSAVAVDKLLIGYADPSAAGAATPAPGTAENLLVQRSPEVPAKQASASFSSPSKPIISLTARLATLPPANEERAVQNPFAHPASWSRAESPVDAASTPNAESPPRDENADARRFRLSMIMLPKSGSTEPPLAVINGEALAPGAVVHGYEIHSIQADRVELRNGSRVIELAIPRPAERRRGGDTES